ncbi:MAG: GAF domain-containing protein [Chloroflexota bacterium]|nr:GAF domain-containing protein [Chloroflexota bacterium]
MSRLTPELSESKRWLAETHDQRPVAVFAERLTHAHEGVTLLDPGGVIVYDSPSMELLGGHAPSARRGQPLSAHIHVEDWPRVSHVLALISQTSSTSQSVTARWRSQDGSWRWLESLVTDSGSASQDAAFLLTSRDITPHVERQMRTTAVLEAARRLAAEPPERLWPTLLEAALGVVKADAGSVLRWHAPTRELVVVHTTLPPSQLSMRFGLGIGAAGLAVERGAPVIVNNYDPAAYAGTAGEAAGAHVEAAVPLQHAGTPLGAVSVLRYQVERPFAPDEIDALAALAGIVAAVLVSRAHMQWQAVGPAIEVLRRELTLLVGYLEVLGNDSELAPTLRKLAESASLAAWRAVQQTSHMRHNGVVLDWVE